MYRAKIMAWIATVALAACAAPPGQSAVPDEESSTAGSNVGEYRASVIDLPVDACTQEGYWSFFESFL